MMTTNSVPKLSEGSLARIIAGETVEKAVLQILMYRAVQEAKSGYRFMVSDGMATNQHVMMITPSLVERISKGDFEKYTIIAVNRYLVNKVESNEGTKSVIFLQDVTVLMPGSQVGRRLGSNEPSGVLSSNVAHVKSSNAGTFSSPIRNNELSRSEASLNSNQNSNTSPGRTLNRANVCPISAITPYFNAWLIRARVTSKAPLRKYSNAKGEGCVFSFDVADESGEIRVTAFNKECDKFYNLIECNKVYYISKGAVKTANKRFSNTQNDYEVTLSSESVIEPCEDSVVTPKLRFKFVEIKNLVNVAAQTIVDIIGICKSVEACNSIMSRKLNKELSKRDIILMDKSSCEIRFTLWNQSAESFDATPGTVIAIKGAMVGDFNGKTLSAGNNTTIHLDPDIPEAHTLKGWYTREGENLTTIPLSKSTSDSTVGWKFVCQVANVPASSDSRIYSNVTATIVSIGKNPLYKSCGINGCLRKVREEADGIYFCDKCQKQSSSFEWRLILSVALNDCTGDAWVTLFQEQGEKLLGMTAQELSSLQENDPQEFNRILSLPTFKQFNFRLGSRLEQYNNESRVKSIAYSSSPLDPIAETKKLIQFIKNWHE